MNGRNTVADAGRIFVAAVTLIRCLTFNEDENKSGPSPNTRASTVLSLVWNAGRRASAFPAKSQAKHLQHMREHEQQRQVLEQLCAQLYRVGQWLCWSIVSFQHRRRRICTKKEWIMRPRTSEVRAPLVHRPPQEPIIQARARDSALGGSRSCRRNKTFRPPRLVSMTLLLFSVSERMILHTCWFG